MAVTGYREVPRRQTLRSAFYHGALERLEPDKTKVLSPVLRGRRASDGPLLPDRLVPSLVDAIVVSDVPRKQ